MLGAEGGGTSACEGKGKHSRSGSCDSGGQAVNHVFNVRWWNQICVTVVSRDEGLTHSGKLLEGRNKLQLC